ncbi:MAG: 50S ribosomal protein L6 [Alphaproteobacteria bacterium]
MSRIGKLPINIPDGVKVLINDDNNVSVTGKLGTLSEQLPKEVSISFDTNENKVKIKPLQDTNRSKAMWGLARSLVFNMVKGVTEGFTSVLEINGIGYKASADNEYVKLVLGHSHDIIVEIPAGLSVKCEKPTSISIYGSSKQKVGQLAASIRKLRKPEPYKGKGIKYEFEKINRKVGKKK